MTKADEVRLELIRDLVGQYMAAYDDLADPVEMADSLVFTISEIFYDDQITKTKDTYSFPDIVDTSDEEDDPPPWVENTTKKASWPTEADLI